MQWKTIILLALLTLQACSVFKKGAIGESSGKGSSVNVNLGQVAGHNLSNSGFFISKAEVEISGKGIEQKILCSIKYNLQGIYLITFRNWTGIEAARLFLTEDTVLMNDRINRKLYYGSNQKLTQRYGFSYQTIGLIFGDYLSSDSGIKEEVTCYQGILKKRSLIDRTFVDYTIDCREEKAVFASAGKNNELTLKYSGFRKFNNIVVPEKVDIVDKFRGIRILFKIDRIEFPREGVIEFIPGSNYERIPLL